MPDIVFKSETELCAAFIAWATPQGWTAYAETAGWDILLVSGDGLQLGVQAKLRFNATLLRQAIPNEWHCETGPDFRAVLLPKLDRDIREVIEFCGLSHFTPSPFGRNAFRPMIDTLFLDDWHPLTRCKLPTYVPDVPAGVPCPVVLTDWKVKALRVCAVLELTGSITSKQIRGFGLDPRRWIHPFSKWLTAKHGTHGVYIRGDDLPFDRQHVEVYANIKAEVAESLRTDPDGKRRTA
jgi:hypothetical protein